MRRPRATHDDGFTLIELLVAITILGILMAALTAAIITGLKTTDDTSTRLAESHDAQIVQVWWPQDVQSATDVSTTDTTCGGVTPFARFRWSDVGITKIASYTTATSGADRQLVRTYCENGAIQTTIVVAHHLAATGPSLSCSSACSGTPRTAAITVTEASGYSYTVGGTRRAT
jgi:prepilin-type N-terminal cleavage/methylation domain-containing protein